MAIRFDEITRNSRLDAVDDKVNNGSGPATIEIRTGSFTGNLTGVVGTQAADQGTLLATLTAGDPMFAAASGGVMEENAITGDSSADASGTPGHFVAKDSDGVKRIVGTCAVGSGDLNFNSAISLGGAVSISNFQLTDGNA